MRRALCIIAITGLEVTSSARQAAAQPQWTADLGATVGRHVLPSGIGVSQRNVGLYGLRASVFVLRNVALEGGLTLSRHVAVDSAQFATTAAALHHAYRPRFGAWQVALVPALPTGWRVGSHEVAVRTGLGYAIDDFRGPHPEGAIETGDGPVAFAGGEILGRGTGWWSWLGRYRASADITLHVVRRFPYADKPPPSYLRPSLQLAFLRRIR